MAPRIHQAPSNTLACVDVAIMHMGSDQRYSGGAEEGLVQWEMGTYAHKYFLRFAPISAWNFVCTGHSLFLGL